MGPAMAARGAEMRTGSWRRRPAGCTAQVVNQQLHFPVGSLRCQPTEPAFDHGRLRP